MISKNICTNPQKTILAPNILIKTLKRLGYRFFFFASVISIFHFLVSKKAYNINNNYYNKESM